MFCTCVCVCVCVCVFDGGCYTEIYERVDGTLAILNAAFSHSSVLPFPAIISHFYFHHSIRYGQPPDEEIESSLLKFLGSPTPEVPYSLAVLRFNMNIEYVVLFLSLTLCVCCHLYSRVVTLFSFFYSWLLLFSCTVCSLPLLFVLFVLYLIRYSGLRNAVSEEGYVHILL